MAATVSTMAMLNAKCLATNPTSQPKLNPTKPSLKPNFLNLPAGLLSTSSKPAQILAGSAIAGAVFSTLSHADPAFAAQQIAELAEGDNRGLALLLPIIPAIGWVLFNILQPALNQINRMRSTKGVIIGLGLGSSDMGSGRPRMPRPPSWRRSPRPREATTEGSSCCSWWRRPSCGCSTISCNRL
ncbi:hypothetical protein BT93_B2835 [Corymbia citriodora subsp. variegata]|nr:hypothetical protein BT93_B2835 [Corymbia citriodora subsp. variegata]